MKKKPSQKLPDPVFTFDDTAIVMLRTGEAAFQLAILLNEAYNLQLSRIDDIYIANSPHPCFFYHDQSSWLAYILIARPTQHEADPAFSDYDKILLIRGRDSWRFQQLLYDDIHSRQYGIALGSATEPDVTNLLKHNQWELCNRLSDSIQRIDIYGFGHRQNVSTLRFADSVPTLFPVDDAAASNAEQRAIASYHKMMQSFLSLTFDALHAHLADEQEL